MRARMFVGALALVCAASGAAAAGAQESAGTADSAVVAEPSPATAAPEDRVPPVGEQLFQSGVDAWLAGNAARAEDAWRAALEEPVPPALRAALLYDLGNAAWHAGRALEAVGWYTAALPLAPRDPDLVDNLDLARRTAGLPPRDRGDLGSTLELYLASWTEAEARWLALLGLLPLLGALLGEALRGGAGWRLTAFFALLLALGTALPYAERRRRADDDAGLVVAATGARLLPEPAGAAGAAPPAGAPLAEAGERVLRLDAIPGWVRVETGWGARGWIPEEQFFELDR